jgi:hypothetical protein
MNIWSVRETARSLRFIAVRTSLERKHKKKHPKRTTGRIPFTLPFIVWSFTYIDERYSSPSLRRVLKAALVAGHAFSIRPGEFLYSTHQYEEDRYLGAGTTLVWFPSPLSPTEPIPYAATAPHTWPQDSSPTHITSSLDHRKNSQNAGQPVSVAANPNKGPNNICCVSVLCDYIRNTQLSPTDPLFVYDGEHLDTTEISSVMKTCAIHHDIDPDRVVPASLRKNVITQMDLNTPEILRKMQGGWKSNTGETHYFTHLLQLADANQAAVHNAGSATIEVIRAIFCTPAATS